MKRILTFILVILICAMIFCAGVMAKAGDADEITATETVTAEVPETEEAGIPAPEGMSEKAKSLWDKFWQAVIDMINGQNARDAVVTVCSILAATVAVLFRRMIRNALAKLGVITNKNGEKTNELIDAVNGNADKIDELRDEYAGKFDELLDKYKEQFAAVEQAVYDARDAEREKNTKIDLTTDTVISLADMIMTIYSSSTTIPDAAKEIMREKYARVLHSVNAAEYGETEGAVTVAVADAETEAEYGDKT